MWRILIVDDEFSNLEALELLLTEEGYDVAVACNGKQALEKLEQRSCDLVLTDHMMPGLSGAQLIEALRADPRHAGLHIVLMSGAPESMLRPLTSRYDGFLRKPFDIDALLGLLGRLLKGRGSPHAAG